MSNGDATNDGDDKPILFAAETGQLDRELSIIGELLVLSTYRDFKTRVQNLSI